MVVILSQESNRSQFVIREVEKAVSAGHFIVPFRIDDVVPSPGMDYLIGSSQLLDALTPPLEKHIEELARALGHLLGRSSDEAADVRAESGARPPAASTRTRPSAARRRAAMWGVPLIVLAAAGLYFAATLLGGGVGPPAPQGPEDAASRVGGALIYSWDDRPAGRSSVRYEVERRTPGGDVVIDVSTALSYQEARAIQGEIAWRVRAVWNSSDGENESSGWSVPRVVTFYPNTLARIVATGHVHLAASEDAILFVDNRKEPTGFEIEFLRDALSDYLKQKSLKSLELDYTLLPWGDEFFHSLSSPRFDVMAAGITIKPEREQDWNVRFTDPLYEYPQSFVLLTGQELCFGARSPASRCRILAKAQTTNADLAERLASEFENVEVRTLDVTNVYSAMANELQQGNAELALMDRKYAVELLERSVGGLLRVKDVDESVMDDPPIERIGIATKVFDADLRRILNAAIESRAPDVARRLAGYDRNEGVAP